MRSQLLTATVVLAAMSASVQAETPAYPPLREKDSWKYTAQVERGGVRSGVGSFSVSVEGRNSQGSLIISNRDPTKSNDKQIADILHVIDNDWCMADLMMQIPILGGKACAKPLRKGQKWRRVIKVEAVEVTLEFRFVGMKDIKVPAGEFSALVIECENTVRSAKGNVRMSREFAYSPEVRGLVYMSNQNYDAEGKPADKFLYGLMAFAGK